MKIRGGFGVGPFKVTELKREVMFLGCHTGAISDFSRQKTG